MWGQLWGHNRLEENFSSVPWRDADKAAVRPPQGLTPPLAVSAQVLEVQQQQPKQQPRQLNLVSQPGEPLRLPANPGEALSSAGDAGHERPGLAHHPT